MSKADILPNVATSGIQGPDYSSFLFMARLQKFANSVKLHVKMLHVYKFVFLVRKMRW